MDTISICAIQKNEAPYLLEWIAFHLNAGVDHIRVYDNGSTDFSKALLNAIAARYPVSVAPQPTLADRSPQIDAYLNGIEWLQERSEFVAFIDIDEFLFGQNDRPLRELLRSTDNDISAIGVNQRIFGSNEEVAYRPDLVTSRFVRRTPVDAPGNQYFKSIARVRRVRNPYAHNVTIKAGRYVFSDGSMLEASAEHPGRATRIVPGQIVLHHYYTKSRAEFEIKRLRGGAAAASEEQRKGRHSADHFDQINKIANEADVTLSRVAERTRAMMREILDAIRIELPHEALELYRPLVSPRR